MAPHDDQSPGDDSDSGEKQAGRQRSQSEVALRYCRIAYPGTEMPCLLKSGHSGPCQSLPMVRSPSQLSRPGPQPSQGNRQEGSPEPPVPIPVPAQRDPAQEQSRPPAQSQQHRGAQSVPIWGPYSEPYSEIYMNLLRVSNPHSRPPRYVMPLSMYGAHNQYNMPPMPPSTPVPQYQSPGHYNPAQQYGAASSPRRSRRQPARSTHQQMRQADYHPASAYPGYTAAPQYSSTARTTFEHASQLPEYEGYAGRMLGTLPWNLQQSAPALQQQQQTPILQQQTPSLQYQTPTAAARTHEQAETPVGSRPLVVDGTSPTKGAVSRSSTTHGHPSPSTQHSTARRTPYFARLMAPGTPSFSFEARGLPDWPSPEKNGPNNDSLRPGYKAPKNSPSRGIDPRVPSGVNFRGTSQRLVQALCDQSIRAQRAADEARQAEEAAAVEALIALSRTTEGATDETTDEATRALQEAFAEVDEIFDELNRVSLAKRTDGPEEGTAGSASDSEEGADDTKPKDKGKAKAEDSPEWTGVAAWPREWSMVTPVKKGKGHSSPSGKSHDDAEELAPAYKAAIHRVEALLEGTTLGKEAEDKNDLTAAGGPRSVSALSTTGAKGVLTEVQLAAQRAEKTKTAAAARERAATGSTSAAAIPQIETVSPFLKDQAGPSTTVNLPGNKVTGSSSGGVKDTDTKRAASRRLTEVQVALPPLDLLGFGQGPSTAAKGKGKATDSTVTQSEAQTKVSSEQEAEAAQGTKDVKEGNTSGAGQSASSPPVPKLTAGEAIDEARLRAGLLRTRIVKPPPGFTNLQPARIICTPPSHPPFSSSSSFPRVHQTVQPNHRITSPKYQALLDLLASLRPISQTRSTHQQPSSHNHQPASKKMEEYYQLPESIDPQQTPFVDPRQQVNHDNQQQQPGTFHYYQQQQAGYIHPHQQQAGHSNVHSQFGGGDAHQQGNASYISQQNLDGNWPDFRNKSVRFLPKPAHVSQADHDRNIAIQTRGILISKQQQFAREQAMAGLHTIHRGQERAPYQMQHPHFQRTDQAESSSSAAPMSQHEMTRIHQATMLHQPTAQRPVTAFHPKHPLARLAVPGKGSGSGSSTETPTAHSILSGEHAMPFPKAPSPQSEASTSGQPVAYHSFSAAPVVQKKFTTTVNTDDNTVRDQDGNIVRDQDGKPITPEEMARIDRIKADWENCRQPNSAGVEVERSTWDQVKQFYPNGPPSHWGRYVPIPEDWQEESRRQKKHRVYVGSRISDEEKARRQAEVASFFNANSRLWTMTMEEMIEDVTLQLLFANYLAGLGLSRADFREEYLAYTNVFDTDFVPGSRENMKPEQLEDMAKTDNSAKTDITDRMLTMAFRNLLLQRAEEAMPEGHKRWTRQFEPKPKEKKPHPNASKFGAIGQEREGWMKARAEAAKKGKEKEQEQGQVEGETSQKQAQGETSQKQARQESEDDHGEESSAMGAMRGLALE